MTFDIHCDVTSSCDGRKLHSSDNLFCNGDSTGQNTRISSIATIYGAARVSLYYADISNTIGDIYCIANIACLCAEINQIGGNVYGIESRCMYDSSIINSIDASGWKAAQEITVNNVKSMSV